MTTKLDELKAAGLEWEDLPAGATFMTRETGRRMIDLGFEIRLLTEVFYYLAESVRTLIKRAGKNPEPLPLLKDPGYIGVSRVRHQLLEHYLPDGRLVATGWSHGGDQGPVLHSVKQEGIETEVQDAGLYVNAREFALAIERRLTPAIEYLRHLSQ